MAETKGSVTLRFDYRWLVVALLLVVIAVMLVLWRPWEPRYDKNASVVTANGQSTVKATPDEYVFRPSYSFENTDKTVSLGEAKRKTDEVVKGPQGCWCGRQRHQVKCQRIQHPAAYQSSDQFVSVHGGSDGHDS